jgi:hypothetical protein
MQSSRQLYNCLLPITIHHNKPRFHIRSIDDYSKVAQACDDENEADNECLNRVSVIILSLSEAEMRLRVRFIYLTAMRFLLERK